MSKQIQCKKISQDTRYNIRVKIIKAPLVDTKILRSVITERARALVI